MDASRTDSLTGLWKYLTRTVKNSLHKLTKAQIDSLVPLKFQKKNDDSSNLIEFEEGGLSQPNFLKDMLLKHPLLIAKQRLDANYVPKSLTKRPWKKERKSQEIVDIDGVKKPWS